MLHFTCEVKVAGGVNDNPHEWEVERSDLGFDLRFNTAMVKVMGAQQAVDGVNGLSLNLSPVKIERVLYSLNYVLYKPPIMSYLGNYSVNDFNFSIVVKLSTEGNENCVETLTKVGITSYCIS